MARSAKPWSATASAQFEDLANRGYTAEEIAKSIGGVSRASVGRRLLEYRGHVRGPRSGGACLAPRKLAAAPAAASKTSSPVALAVAVLAILRRADAQLDAYLSKGATLVDALLSTGGHDGLMTLYLPEHFAELAIYASEEPGIWGPEEGESSAAFAAWCVEHNRAAHRRAVTLLEGALAIVKAQVAS